MASVPAPSDQISDPAQKLKPSPESKASIISQLTFAWPTKLFALAKRKTLQQEDLWELPTGDQAQACAERWAEAWRVAEAARRAKKHLSPNSILGKADREAIFTQTAKRYLGYKFFVVAPLVKLLNSTLQFTFPVLLSGVLSFIEGSKPYGFLDVTPAVGYGLTGALFGAMLCKAITENTYFFLCMRAGWRLRAAITTGVFSKSLKLSASARQQRTLGEMVNLMQIDATKLEMFCTQFHVMWDGLYQITGYLVILSQLIGWPTLLGVVVMIFSVPVQIVIMGKQTKRERAVAGHTDKRVKAVNEMMQSMANVKMYAWEQRLGQLIGEHRGNEIRMRRGLAMLLAFSRSYMMAVPVLVSIAAFVAYALSNGEIRASILFSALTAFSQLRFPLMFYPMALAGLAQARVARSRLSGLFATAETTGGAAGGAAGGELPAPRELPTGEQAAPLLEIRDGEFWWAEPSADSAQGAAAAASAAQAKEKPKAKKEKKEKAPKAGKKTGTRTAEEASAAGKDGKPLAAPQGGGGDGGGDGDGGEGEGEGGTFHRPTLRDVSIDILPGELVAVVGPTGVGKSSLVSALLGEMVQVKGTPINATGQGLKVAYAAQTPWILNATVRDNITFGEAWNPQLYDKVVAACQLETDLKALPHGDMTEIGERGITLSGGQKQRVAVARCAYGKHRDLFILDDVLSALDPEVASQVFERCVLSHLKGTTRVLVTNRLDLAPRCDRVIVLELTADGSGTVSAIGTHEELLRAGGSYAQLMADAKMTHAPSAAAGEGEGAAGAGAGAPGSPAVGSTPGSPAVGAAPGSPLVAAKGANGSIHSANQPAGGSTALMQQEERMEGKVKVNIYGEYLRRGGGVCGALLVLCLHTICTACMVGSTLWVGFWTADATPVPAAPASLTAPAPLNLTLSGPTTFAVPAYSRMPFAFYVAGYAIIGLVVALLSFVRTYGAALFCLAAAKNLHLGLVGAVLRAPLSFFDTTPIGRIVSRFSKDMYSIDHELLDQADMFIFMIMFLLANFGTIIAATPWFAVGIVPIMAVYVYFVRFFMPVARECKRLESIARSPVFAHYSETLGGIPTIRAYGAQARFVHANLRLVDKLNEAYYVNKIADRWLSARLECVGATIVFFASVLAVAAVVGTRATGASVDPMMIGLFGTSLVGASGITGILTFVMRMYGQLEASFTSVERVVYYIRNIPQEKPVESPKPPPNSWPSSGAIEIKDLRMKYREDTPMVLKGLSASIGGGQRVGIVGRTGSGKSSLLLSLLRLVEPMPKDGEGGATGGGGSPSPSIAIDGIDIESIGLGELRRKLAIIPQSPALFSGSIRSNIDPFDDFTDEQIWAALDKCEMRPAVMAMVAGSDSHHGASDPAKALQAPVAEYGENLSQGQRQLICLTRAVLQQAKILILDEATSAVDYGTDARIQSMIRTTFSGCTILVIAHRINTIIDSDLILVLGDGVLVESGPPQKLIDDKQSAFAKIVAESQSGGASS